MTIHWIIKWVHAKNLKATLFIDLSKAFDSIHRKDGANTISVWSTQRICCNYNNALWKQRFAHMIDINFNIIAGDLLEDTFASYLFIICLDSVHGTSIDLIKENDFTLKKSRSKWYPADADNTNNLVLLVHTPAEIESLLHNLEQAVGGIDLHVNANKTVHVF